MKGFLPLFFCASLLSVVIGDDANAGVNSRNLYGDLNLHYGSTEVVKDSGHAYIGLHADLSFLTWENEYKNENNVTMGFDTFNFKPVVGLDVVAGYKSNEKWRADLEIGYMGKYSESETEYYTNAEHTNLDLEAFYLSMNGYYDLWRGIYAGLGVGIAFVETSVDSTVVACGSKTKTSPLGAVMLGWAYPIDDRTDFDIRYRFAVFDAGDSIWPTADGGWIKMESGTIKNNTLSLGIRYSF